MWWRCEVASAHVGTGRFATHYNYVWAKDAAEALVKLNNMRGWKRRGEKRLTLIKNKQNPSLYPNLLLIEPITDANQIKQLEEEIVQRISIQRAKKYGYYGRRRNGKSRKF